MIQNLILKLDALLPRKKIVKATDPLWFNENNDAATKPAPMNMGLSNEREILAHPNTDLLSRHGFQSRLKESALLGKDSIVVRGQAGHDAFEKIVLLARKEAKSLKENCVQLRIHRNKATGDFFLEFVAAKTQKFKNARSSIPAFQASA